jgi:biopolymer transport protein ExbD
MKPINQINVIPFIDVMLVLLAIVLTTATFIAQGTIPVSLPTAEHTTTMNPADHIKIVISEAGEYYLSEEVVSIDDLDARFAKLGRHTPVVLKVDAMSRFEMFVDVIDLLKGYQLENVAIVAESD